MPVSKIFDPTTQVNLVADTITITGHGLQPYQGLLYNNGGGASIGGLVNGYKYYAIFIDVDTIKLAVSEQDARDSIAVDLLTLGSGPAHSFTTTNVFPQSSAYYDFFRSVRLVGGSLPSPGAKFEADSVRDTLTIVGGPGIVFSNINEQQDAFTINAGEYNLEVPVGTTNIRLYNEIDGVTTDSQEMRFTVDRGINITRISDTELRFEGLGVTETDTLHSVSERGNITANTLYMNNIVVGKIQSIPGEDGVVSATTAGTTGNAINLTGDGTLDNPLEIDLFYSTEASKTVQVNFSTPASGTLSYSASYKAETVLATGSVILQREEPSSPGTWVTIDSASGTVERTAYTIQNIYAEPNAGTTNFRIIISWTGLGVGYVDFPINVQFEITPIAINEMIVSDTANKTLSLGILDGDINIRGNVNVFDQLSTDGLTIFNNNIQTINSNDNLVLDPNGAGALELRSQTLLTDQTTFNLVNTTATTVNFAGAATTLEIGAATGDTNVNNNLIVDLDLQVRGGDITTNQTSFNLLNATAATINAFGAATTLSIGAVTGTTTVNNNLTVSGDLTVNGTTTTLNTTTLDVEDLNITVAKGSVNSAAANGAGLTVDGALASLLYSSANDSWNFNKLLTASSLQNTPVGNTTASTGRFTTLQTVDTATAAHNLTLASTSSTALTANRTLTVDVVNANRTIKLAGNIDIANSFTTSGNFALTLTTTASTDVTLPDSGTLYGTKTNSITSLQLATSVSDRTGSGALVFGTSPTIGTPDINGGTADSLTSLSVRDIAAAFDLSIGSTSSPALTSNRSLTINVENGDRSLILGGDLDLGGKLSTADNFTTSGNFPLTLTTTGTTSVTLPTSGTLATTGNLSQFASTTSSQLAGVISDETGSGALVFGTSPTLSTPRITYPTLFSDSVSNLTVNAETTTLVSWIGNFGANQTLSIINLTDGRMVRIYVRNINTSSRIINVQASTSISGFTAVNLGGGSGSMSSTSFSVVANSGTAIIEVFNAGGQLVGGVI